MDKQIYHYDSNSATYQPIQKTTKQKLFPFAIPILALGFGIALTYFLITDNQAKENILTDNSEKELAEMKTQFETLNQKFEQSQKALSDIEERDNNIYRAYFELDEISEDVRKAGYGGVNRYAQFETMKYGDIVSEATKNLDILNKQLVIQSESLDEIHKVAEKKDEMFAHIPAIQPIANKELRRLSSGYGMRLHPVLKVGKMHWGLDFKADPGTPIYATADATVERADRMGGYGNVVVLNHGYGYETLYAHMQKHNVTAGQQVKRGDIIGFVGSTGLSSGPHLHYEVHKNGEKVNPISFFYQDVSPDEFKILLEKSEEMSISLD